MSMKARYWIGAVILVASVTSLVYSLVLGWHFGVVGLSGFAIGVGYAIGAGR